MTSKRMFFHGTNLISFHFWGISFLLALCEAAGNVEYDEKTDKGRGSNSCALPFLFQGILTPEILYIFVPYLWPLQPLQGASSEANHDDSSYSTTPPGCSFWDDKFNASRNKVPGWDLDIAWHREVISILCCLFLAVVREGKLFEKLEKVGSIQQLWSPFSLLQLVQGNPNPRLNRFHGRENILAIHGRGSSLCWSNPSTGSYIWSNCTYQVQRSRSSLFKVLGN